MLCFPGKTQFSFKNIHKISVNGLKKLSEANGNQRKAEVAKFISENKI